MIDCSPLGSTPSGDKLQWIRVVMSSPLRVLSLPRACLICILSVSLPIHPQPFPRRHLQTIEKRSPSPSAFAARSSTNFSTCRPLTFSHCRHPHCCSFLLPSSGSRSKEGNGRYFNDVRNFFGILDPLPPFVTHSRNLSLVFVTYWLIPLPPSVRTTS